VKESNLSGIEKAIFILEQLSKPPYDRKVSDIANSLDFNRTSVYRILRLMEGRGIVSQDSQRGVWRIGPAAYHIGSSYLYAGNRLASAGDILAEISEKTKESVGMAVKDGDKIISVLEVEIHQPNKLNDLPGRYFPPNKGCYGKCLTAYQPSEYIERVLSENVFEKTLPNTLTTREELLAEYARIRENGYCTSIDEKGIDILSVAVPVFDARGHIAACVAVAMFRRDGWEQEMADIRDLLLSYRDRLNRLFP
jgi:DNA-binding IclR family transcriptional regulator